jgi:1-deoxy-D-xylulose-5-phosphate synthase
MYETALRVANEFSPDEVAVFDAKFVKPIDAELLKQLANFEYIFTIEDGIRTGGFGEQLQAALPKEVHTFAFPDIFPETGTRDELFARYELDAETIKNIIKESTNAKQKKTQLGN